MVPEGTFAADGGCDVLTVKNYRLAQNTAPDTSILSMDSVDILGTAVNTTGETLAVGRR